MATNYPTSTDTNGTGGTLNVQASTTPLSTGHVASHQNLTDAVLAIETKVGVDSSIVTTTIDYKLKSTSSIDPGHKHTPSVSLAATGTPSATTVLFGNNTWATPPTAADASTTVKGVTKLDTAPASASSPIAVGVNSAVLNTTSGTALDGITDKIVDSADVSAASSANKIARQDANGKIPESMTYFDYQVFTVNGTWTKPIGLTGNEPVRVQVWGGGGAGGGVTSGTGAGGGGGGSFLEGVFRASDLGSTEIVTVGASVAGTTGNGSAGNNSSFGSHVTAYGGGGGAGSAAGAGGGAGVMGKGNSSTSGTNADGGIPLPGIHAGVLNSTFGGGAGDNNPGYSVYGGGGGGTVAGSGPAGNSIYGGGGGAGALTSNPAGGTSSFGGAGGTYPGTNVNGGDGSTPGGGGSGAARSGAGSNSGGAGARGEIRVWVLA